MLRVATKKATPINNWRLSSDFLSLPTMSIRISTTIRTKTTATDGRGMGISPHPTVNLKGKTNRRAKEKASIDGTVVDRDSTRLVVRLLLTASLADINVYGFLE